MEKIITTETFDEALEILNKHVETHGRLAFDTETTGLRWHEGDRMFGIGIGWELDDIFYFPFRHKYPGSENLPESYIQPLVKLLGRAKTLYGYNIKFDLHMMMMEGFDLEKASETQFLDVLPLYRIVEYSHVKGMSLRNAISRLIGEEEANYDIELKKYLKLNNFQKNFDRASISRIGPYCIKDVDMCIKVYKQVLGKYNDEHEYQYLPEVEDRICRMTRMFLEMERVGVRLDRQQVEKARDLLSSEISRTNKIIQDMVGGEAQNSLFGTEEDTKYTFNPGSSDDVMNKLLERGTQLTKKTDTKAYSSEVDVLAGINDPLAGYVLRYRKLVKYLSTYVEPFLDKDRVYTLFNTGGAATGRISSSEPNFQNLPNRHYDLTEEVEITDNVREQLKEEVARMAGNSIEGISDDVLRAYTFLGRDKFDDEQKHINIRRFFLPDDDYYFVSMDFSQMELRVLFYYLKNQELLDSLKTEGLDIHSENAKRAFGVAETDPKFSYYRKLAKGITFGVIYGLGDKGLGLMLNITPKEAKQYKDQFLNQIGGLGEWFYSVIKAIGYRAEQLGYKDAQGTPLGYVQTPFGRRMYITKDSAYKGVNYLVQSMAGEMANESFYKAYQYLKDKKSYPAGHIHDEIILMIHKDELYLIDELRNVMAENQFDIPLQVDADICDPSWINSIDADKYLTSKNIDVNIRSVEEKPLQATKKESVMPKKKKTEETLEIKDIEGEDPSYLSKEDMQEYLGDHEEEPRAETQVERTDIFNDKKDEYVVLVSIKAQYSSKLDGGDKHSSASAEIGGVPAIWRSKEDNTVNEISQFVIKQVQDNMKTTMPRLFGIVPTPRVVDTAQTTEEEVIQQEIESA